MWRRHARPVTLALGAALLGAVLPVASATATPDEVDESRLQPALSLTPPRGTAS